MSTPLHAIEVTPRDLSRYRAGNTGIDYVHRFASGRPGPHVMINGLTHGNEFCGMAAVCHLLDSDVRPKIGTLTLSFANVAAYETFDATQPFESRLITHNLNRIWSSAWLDGKEDSVELRRAREMRPAAMDFLGHFSLIERTVPPPATPPHRFELLRTHVIQHESFAFVRPVIGFETFAEGELIATDGPLEIRALCDDCTIFMPARAAIVGREGVYLTKPLG
jgi:succinylglutamate desuccinylase